MRPLQEPLAGGTVLKIDRAEPSYQTNLRHLPKRGQVTDMDLYALVAIVLKRLNQDISLYTMLQIFSIMPFEKISLQQELTISQKIIAQYGKRYTIESIRVLTGHYK